jgi:hypothetical protein
LKTLNVEIQVLGYFELQAVVGNFVPLILLVKILRFSPYDLLNVGCQYSFMKNAADRDTLMQDGKAS